MDTIAHPFYNIYKLQVPITCIYKPVKSDHYIMAISFDNVYQFFFTYVSTHPGSLWRCHGCHRMA